MTKICVIDDDIFIGKMLGMVLKKQGYQFRYFQNGYEALDDFSKNNYDVVLLDVMMPEIDGFSVFEELQVRYPEVPVLFLSANQTDDNLLFARENGAFAYITKPFDLILLYEKIAEAVRYKVDNGHVV